MSAWYVHVELCELGSYSRGYFLSDSSPKIDRLLLVLGTGGAEAPRGAPAEAHVEATRATFMAGSLELWIYATCKG